jgi:hypothetical protein
VAAHETTRQRLGMHVSESFCMGCHTVIDGIGFGFEEFDGMGVYRTSENGLPVDTSGTLQRTDVDGPFVGVAQLAEKLASSQAVPGCYVKQVYRFAMGNEESPAAQDALTAMGAGFTVDSRVTDPLEALVADPAFVLRTAAQPGP